MSLQAKEGALVLFGAMLVMPWAQFGTRHSAMYSSKRQIPSLQGMGMRLCQLWKLLTPADELPSIPLCPPRLSYDGTLQPLRSDVPIHEQYPWDCAVVGAASTGPTRKVAAYKAFLRTDQVGSVAVRRGRLRAGRRRRGSTGIPSSAAATGAPEPLERPGPLPRQQLPPPSRAGGPQRDQPP